MSIFKSTRTTFMSNKLFRLCSLLFHKTVRVSSHSGKNETLNYEINMELII